MDRELLDYFHGDELASSTWLNKYAQSGDKTPNDMHRRMAKEFARIEMNYPNPLSEEEIYDMFKGFKYVIPGGSIMATLGVDNQLVSTSNCTVLDGPDDTINSIMDTARNMANLFKRRCGVGFDLSKLRPRAAKVANSANSSTGAASFMDIYSLVTNTISQNGRRGALMLTMDIRHPDVEEFIMKKQDLTKVTGANVSVKVTDAFMKSVEEDIDFYLSYPIDTTVPKDMYDIPYNTLVRYEDNYYFKRVKAKDLWNKLIHCAWNTAEPGVIFNDTMINYAPDGGYDKYRMISTNPCGEIGMAVDTCRLMHLNLTSFVNKPFTEQASFDFEKFEEISKKALRMADDLVDLEVEYMSRMMDKFIKENNKEEFELWNKYRINAINARRTGLGFTGLADLTAMMGYKYCSEESKSFIELIMRTMFKNHLKEEMVLTIERGHFNDWNKNSEHNDWFKMLQTEFPDLYDGLNEIGRRNISWGTVAPTGTVSLMAQCSSGVEPVFKPWYIRRRKCIEGEEADYTDKVGEKYKEFLVIHNGLKQWCDINGYPYSNLKEIDEAFVNSPYYQACAEDIDWKNRVEIQGIIQKYITHSISSTVNLPESITEEEVSELYMTSWKTGNKGQTIYRQGSREGVLVEKSKEKPADIPNTNAPKRPKELEADYYEIKVKGEQFIVLVGILNGKPYEIFAFRPNETVNFGTHKGKIIKLKKMHYKFESEFIKIEDLQKANINIEENAATLYSSMLLRHGIDLEYIIKTAKKVNDNITSFSSAMCRVLSKYIKNGESKTEVCPECGSHLMREGGCLICKNCGWSKCG